MVQFKFHCVDYWNRPVFKAINSDLLIGSLDKLIPNDEISINNDPVEISKYFNENKRCLSLFGTNIDDDPLGKPINPDKFEIITFL